IHVQEAPHARLCSANAPFAVEWICARRRLSVHCGYAHRQPRRHYSARAAHPERSRRDRLRRYPPHAKAPEPLQHRENAGQLSRTQRDDALAGIADPTGAGRQNCSRKRRGHATGLRSRLPPGDPLRAPQNSGGPGAWPFGNAGGIGGAGLPNEEFLFVGFLPQRRGERRRMLEHLRIEERTMIFYEAPHRVAECIADAQEILGDRPACIAREVTKLHEEFLRGKLSQLAESLAERPARGEITLVVGPPEASAITGQADSQQSLSDRVDELIRQAKLDRKEALKLAAKERGLTRRAAYEQLVESKAKPN